MTITKKILIITVLIGIIVFIATKKLIYGPSTQKLKNGLETLEEEYDKNRIFFEIEKLKDEIDSRVSLRMLKSEKELPWFLSKISETFNLLDLELISLEPQPLERTSFYTIIPVKVKTICSYHSLGELISRLENLEKFIDIGHLKLASFAKIELKAEKEKKPLSPIKMDKRGFVLLEVGFKINAFYLP